MPDSPGDRPAATLIGPPGLVEALDAELRALVLGASSLQVFEAGEVVIRAGDSVEHLFVVEDGMLRAEVPDRHGVPIEVARFVRADYCGEMAFLRGEPASATVRAVTPAKVWKVPHATLRTVAERSPAFMRELALVLSRRLTETNRRFRQSHSGRVAVVIGESPAAGQLLGHVAQAVSLHLRQPVAVLDLGAQTVPGDVMRLPSLAELAVDPARMVQIEAFVGGGGVHVGAIDGSAEIGEGGLLQLIAELRRVLPALIVASPWSRASSLAGSSDVDVAFVIEEESAARPATRDIPVVLLRPGGQPVAPARIARFREESKREVIRVLSSHPAPLAGARPAGAHGEPWASVDWLARHILGRKVGLALGAGGSKGYAHAGVIEALAEMGVTVDYVAGCSIGAPIAAAYVRGIDTGTIRGWLDHTFARSIKLTLPFRSLLSSRLLTKDMERYFGGLVLEEQALPLSIVAVDLERRREVVFRRGPIARAIVASMAIPGIFPPVRIGGRTLVDGGVLNPVPVGTVARSGADVVIGVKLSSPAADIVPTPERRGLRAPPIIDTIHHAFEVMQWRIVADGAIQADITIEPAFSGATGLRQYTRSREFIDVGREAALAARPEIRRHLPWID